MATATLIDTLNNKVARIKPIDYSVVKFKDILHTASVTEVLPFRVKFTSINIEPIGLGNVPGIGFQVIGYSNYIL